ncbi:MAG: diaminopimelate epimerase [Calditrichia bacterium]
MGRKISFVKMQAAGNDFILIDNRHRHFTGSESEFFRNLCDRHFGIGADGLMLLDYKIPSRFHLLYLNSDGKPAEMCGNGARCAVYFMHLQQPEQHEFTFQVGSQMYRGEVLEKERVRIFWNTEPRIIREKEWNKSFTGDFPKALFIHSGVPHLVLYVADSLGEVDVAKWGSYFRHHPAFSPEGTNVDFVQIRKDHLDIRTYERGVEAETLACGTGALAAAVAAEFWGDSRLPLDIVAKGGVLRVGREEEKGAFWLEGPVKMVFSGYFDRSDFH